MIFHHVTYNGSYANLPFLDPPFLLLYAWSITVFLWVCPRWREALENWALLIITILVMWALPAKAQTYTEFYCDASAGAGTNINAGSTTAAAAVYTSVNGNWDGTSIFTPTDGTTPASTVSAGMWLSIYYDNSTNLVQAGTMGGGIGIITNVAAGANGAVTIDRRTVSGTVPTSSATGRSIKVGGSWAGPYKVIGFPFGFIGGTSTNGPFVTRVNFKNASDYVITAAMSHGVAGPVIFQGYTSSPGDKGRAHFLDNATSASYILLTVSGAHNNIVDAIFSASFSSGVSSGITLSGSSIATRRVVVHDIRVSGFSFSSNVGLAEECEAYNCNQNNSGGGAGFQSGSPGVTFVRCISHDNTTAASDGFNLGSGAICINCIADSNGKEGFNLNASGCAYFIQCDSFANGDDGIDFQASTAQEVWIENCNLIANGGFGINSSGSSTLRMGHIINCAFGSGVVTNIGGNIAPIQGVYQSGNFVYSGGVMPWVDPANGDFRINLRAAKSAGYGNFLQTQASYSGTVGYPDIGAAQSPSTNTPGSWTFSQ